MIGSAMEERSMKERKLKEKRKKIVRNKRRERRRPLTGFDIELQSSCFGVGIFRQLCTLRWPKFGMKRRGEKGSKW
jgi:hypothetical protein